MKEEEKFLNWLKDNVNELYWHVSKLFSTYSYETSYKDDNISLRITVSADMIACTTNDEAKMLYAREYPVISEIADEIMDRINIQNTNKFWHNINECLNNKD